MLVSLPHGLTVIVVGALEHHGEEMLLHVSLLLHIDGFEEGVDHRISKHLVVELVNCEVDGGLPSKSIVESLFGLLHFCVEDGFLLGSFVKRKLGDVVVSNQLSRNLL